MKPHLYFIAIIPPAGVFAEIETIKKEFSKKYSSHRALKSPVHITLQIPFRRMETIEKPLDRLLKVFTVLYQPFEIELNGFNHFHDKVIFIKVVENKNLDSLFGNLNIALRTQLNFSEQETPQRFNPHVTVAYRDLVPEQFKIAWEQFQHRGFSKTFSATKISLLKHNSKFWEIINEFSFEGFSS
ncbi:MAG: 2'-5' RNA ligase family protein [Bacteroidia bacterium]